MSIEFIIIVAAIAIGFALLSAIMILGFRKVSRSVDRQAFFERKRQKILIGREKAVLAASLIGEINENKNKCEAFITIYSEMLRGLRDDSRKPSYQQTGDFVHKSPSLSRSVYDGNLANMTMLEAGLVTELAEIYSIIETDPEYLSLDPDMPLETALRLVEMIVKNAESVIASLNKVHPSLEVVVRNAPKASL